MAKVDLKTITPKKLHGRNAPNTGDYRAGDVVLNINPSDGIYGWVCKTSGNPGVWDTLSLDGEKNASGKVTLVGNGKSYTVEFQHNLGYTPTAVSATPANRVAGESGIVYVSVFNQSGIIYLKNPIPSGSTAEVYWVVGK